MSQYADLIKRLLAFNDAFPDPQVEEAIDAITSLEAERERLREALEEIASAEDGELIFNVRAIARAAINEEQGK